MKKIIVNPEACIGCGACVAIDPEHFAFNDEGLSNPISEENLESETLMSAIDSCPTSAISLKEQDEEAQGHETQDNDNESNDTCECKTCHCNETENCGCHKEEI